MLIRAARAFWYNNESGIFSVPGSLIERWQIQQRGGPRVELDGCRTCQESEWLSRCWSENLFREHECPTSKRARWLCERYGKDEWSYLHQDFSFAMGCDEGLNAPRCAYIVSDQVYRWHIAQGGNHLQLNRRRGFAQAFQYDCITFSSVRSRDVDLEKYDLIFTNNRKGAEIFYLPSTAPMIAWGHDIWHANAQELLDAHRARFLLASCPESWTGNFEIPPETEVVPYYASASNFYTRPDLRKRKKKIDLLAIGSRRGGVYAPRRKLDEQLRGLDKKRFRVEFSHRLPRRPSRNREPLSADKNRYLNFYSAHLGRARFVIFGPCGSKSANPRRGKRSAADMLMPKYFECLGSGAIPIIPHVTQLDVLGLEPYRHYIPLADVWGDNKRLENILANYGKHFQIAENAVKWHKKNSDALLFDHFEDVVRRATGCKYPRRDY
jgi:hypothetical protein